MSFSSLPARQYSNVVLINFDRGPVSVSFCLSVGHTPHYFIYLTETEAPTYVMLNSPPFLFVKCGWEYIEDLVGLDASS